MPEKDIKIKKAIKKVVGTSRKGREKVIYLVKKRYPEMGAYQIRRVYEQFGFALSKRLRRRIKDNPANPIEIPLSKNVEWAIDFMSDALTSGRRIRTLNVIDHYNRECEGISVGYNIPARMVIMEMEKIIEKHGKPKAIRTDNGPEFRSKLFQKWLFLNNIEWNRIQKGKPQQNAIVERFNKTYREDILDANLFGSLSELNDITQRWVDDYNKVRPHQSLNYKTPEEYAA
jgi:putative transposase